MSAVCSIYSYKDVPIFEKIIGKMSPTASVVFPEALRARLRFPFGGLRPHRSRPRIPTHQSRRPSLVLHATWVSEGEFMNLEFNGETKHVGSGGPESRDHRSVRSGPRK